MALLLLISWESAVLFRASRLLPCKGHERLVVPPPDRVSAQRTGGASVTPARAPTRNPIEHEQECYECDDGRHNHRGTPTPSTSRMRSLPPGSRLLGSTKRPVSVK